MKMICGANNYMKIKMTQSLIDKAYEAFRRSGNEMILTNQGLNRTELRMLEKTGIIEKVRLMGKRKYVDSSYQVLYGWKLIKLKIGAPDE